MEALLSHWHWIVTPIVLVCNAIATAHVVLQPKDSRAAIGWVGVIWLTPLVGSLLYFFFGINRIRRRAYRLRKDHVPVKRAKAPQHDAETTLANSSVPEKWHLAPLVRLTGAVTGQHLFPGNRIAPLRNGDQAYPAMIYAIHEAKKSVSLSTYIFANDRAGKLFVEALQNALERGVAVRVLIDGIGIHYSWPISVMGELRRAKIPAAEFLPALFPWRFNYANMRSHRKILVVDGQIGFTGGTNISEQNDPAYKPRQQVRDIHFRIEGPAVALLQEAFADDWLFSTGESLDQELWFPELQERGPILARGVSSGPDVDFEKLRMIYLGALACARERVKIVTPYFLPDEGLIAAINTASLRGVKIDIVVPIKNNMRLVQWASNKLLKEFLEHGCKVWQAAEPFDHTKLLLVDSVWTFLGSANWDARSLRLNFEFNLECYDLDLARELEQVVEEMQRTAKQLTLADLNGRSLPFKLRDGLAGLLTPYL